MQKRRYLRYDILERIGEGNRGEVYKAKLEDGRIVAIKWAKNYDIDKEWEILNYLNGNIAPKPIFRGKRFFAMEFIDGMPLKKFIGKKEYYEIIKNALESAYQLDEMGVFHKQLGRYYHILNTKSGVRFIDFERAVFSKKPRNFMQIIGYYLITDKNFDKSLFENVIKIYKKDKFEGLMEAKKVIDEYFNKTF